MVVENHVVRPATPEDEAAIAALVVDGFMDMFRPAFGSALERAIPVMERWVRLEHAYGGVESLVVEGRSGRGITASIGVRVSGSSEEVLGRGLWKALRHNLGLARALWAMTLLSHPRYFPKPQEAYIERLIVAPDYRRRGAARSLLAAAEELAREHDKRIAVLHVSGVNEPAIGLYEHEGYCETFRQRSLLTGYFMGIREWIHMQKEL